jgi:hypothetical protein
MSKLLYHGDGKYSTQLYSKALTKGECACMLNCVNQFAMEDKAPETMRVQQFDWGKEGQPLWVTFAYKKDGWNAPYVNLSALPYKAIDLTPLLTKSTILDTPNRVITVKVPVRALMSMLGNWRYHNAIELPIMEGCQSLDYSGKKLTLPKDYEVIQTSVDMFARSVSVFISHHTFDEVIEGQIPPQYCMMTYCIEILHADKVMIDKETNLPIPTVVTYNPEKSS